MGEDMPTGPVPEAQLPQLVRDVLDILHGARSLPPAESVEALRPFVNAMRNRVSANDRLAAASAAAVAALVQSLEAEGVATDDLWEKAIESTLSFAHEVAAPAQP
jgi:ABC-type branched-subunit amino acid transport system substrate-binding protein